MKFKVKEIRPNIIAVAIADNYDRAMLFWRVQEFYESPCKRFRGGKFSIWDYARWYSRKTGCFSYPKDFVGFNLPLVVAKKCYETNSMETPYDEEMSSLINSLFVNGERQYLIGAESFKGGIFEHELAHALYYTDVGYKLEMDNLTKSIPKKSLAVFRKNLLKLGYHAGVVKDEVQAYMATEVNEKICRGVPNKKAMHKEYRKVFRRYR
jgi:hypothetical protein